MAWILLDNEKAEFRGQHSCWVELQLQNTITGEIVYKRKTIRVDSCSDVEKSRCVREFRAELERGLAENYLFDEKKVSEGQIIGSQSIIRALQARFGDRLALESSMKCENCGGQMGFGDEMCPYCGTPNPILKEQPKLGGESVSYQRIQSDMTSALSNAASEKVMSDNRELANTIAREGLHSGLVARILEVYKSLSEAYAQDIQGFQSSLTSANSEADNICSTAKSTAKKRRDTDVADADKARDAKRKELERIRAENTEAKHNAEQRIEESTKIFNALLWLDKKTAKKSYQAEMERLKNTIEICQKKVADADTALQAADRYRKTTVERIEAEYSKQVAEATKECQDVRQTCAKLESQRKASLAQAVTQFLERLIPEDKFKEYMSKVEAIRPNYEEFVPMRSDSFKSPGEFYLGFMRWRTGINPMIKTLSCQYIASSISESIVGLPYTVKLDQGLQVLIRPTGPNDAFWDNDCVRALTIRLLMAYPPGKLQMTLIDSFKNGMSFSGIPDIVDKHHESIISGGVLTEAEFIAQALKSLRTKMGNYSGNQGYGKDKESYFQREPVQAVMINDFPNGFTSNSLADLARLMENGDAFGMIFVIGMNPTYEEKFANSADYKAILSRASMVCVSGSDPASLQYNDTPFEFFFGDEEDIIKNSSSIIAAMREGVITSKGRKEHFSQLFPNPTDWQDENAWRRHDSLGGVMIPLGISGASRITQINVGMPGANTLHHGLITGPTGAGKSTALHTMIMSVILNYPPDEVRLVLIDFKEGTEFRSYAPYNIPNFRSITTATEPELALAALEDVLSIYKARTTVMTDINDYRQDSESPECKILVFFDEVQALFASEVKEEIRNRCLEIITQLVTKGRAMGIHVFLASQSFERVSCIQPLMSDMKIRLCLKDTDTGGILEDADALRDASAGSAILNNQGGASDKNDLFQVCMLEDDEREMLLDKLSRIYAAPEMRERYKSFKTRLLFTNIEDDLNHPFNAFIDEGKRPSVHEMDPVLRVGSLLRQEGNSNPYMYTGNPFNIVLEAENLLLIGDNSSVARSLFIFSMLSIGVEALSRKPDFNDEIILLDFTEGGMYSEESFDENSGESTIKSVYGSFPSLIKHVPTAGGERRSRRTRTENLSPAKPPMEAELDRLYQLLKDREAECDQSPDPEAVRFSRVFLMGFAINSALRLANADSQEGGMYSELSSLAKLQEILTYGPMYDIYCVFWGQTIASTNSILNFNSAKPAETYFKNRVVFSASDGEFQSLAACVTRPATKEGAAYCNVNKNGRVYFRPFDIPKIGWVEDFRERLEETVGY